MSREIDERIVQMKFDNQDFEKHATQTMSTVDKLKDKLNMQGVKDGLTSVSGAIKKVTFDPIGASAEKVNAKIVAMESVIFTTCQRITNKVIDTGKNLVNAFTIDPVKSGLDEYETQLNAIQTILANTSSKGTTLDDVNAALNELNHYADLTIYNFTEMTRNIGTFTAAGIGLEESTKAIKGIANLAAVSGSTSQQASTAMYQLSQALATGTVKLMDWNSVVNAGMGGEVFQNAIKETARVHGVAIDEIIEANGSFRDSLQEGWLTSEILIETLENFTLEQTEYNKQMLLAKGYTDEQADSILNMAVTATDAATKVKTFSQLMDTLKEAAQSGWTQTWQYILGDFDEAKELFTYLSDTFSDIINGSSDARNNLLQGALSAKAVTEDDWNNLKISGDITEEFQQQLIKTAKAHGVAIDEMIASEGGFTASLKQRWLTFDILSETLDGFASDTVTATNTVSTSLEHFEEIAKRVISGEFGNGDERKRALEELGEDYASVQSVVNNLILGTEISIENLSDAQLQNEGYTQEQIDALRQLAAQADATGTPLAELMADMEKPTGRELLIDSVKIAIEEVLKLTSALKKAWRNVFPATTSKQIYNVIEAFHKLIESNQLTLKENNELIRTFRGLFSILDLVRELLNGGVKIAWTVLNTVLKSFDTSLLEVTANIGDYFYALRNGIKENETFKKTTDAISNALVKVIKGFKQWYSENEILQSAISKIKNAIKAASDATLDWVTSNEGLNKMMSTVGKILGDAITAIVDWADSNDLLTKAFSTTITFVSESAKYIVDWIDKFRDLPQVQNFMDTFKASAIVAFDNIASGARVGKDIIGEFINKVKEMNGLSFGDLSRTWNAIKDTFKSSFTDMLDLLTGATFSFDGFTGKVTESSGLVGTAFKTIKDVAGGFFSYIKKLIDNVSLGDLILLFTGITTFLGGRAILDMIDRVIKIGESFSGVADSMKGAFKATSKALNAYTDSLQSKKLVDAAVSIGILAASIWILAQLPIPNLIAATAAIITLSGALLLLSMNIAAMSKIKDFNMTSKAIATLTASMLLLSVAVKVMSTMELDKAIIASGLLLTLMSGIILVCKLLMKNNTIKIEASALTVVAFSAAVLILVAALKKISEVSENGNPLAACVTLIAIITSLVAASKLIGKLDLKSAASLILLALSIKLIISALDTIASVDYASYLTSIASFLTVIVAVKLMLESLKSANENAVKAGVAMIAISLAFALMVKVIKNIASIPAEDLILGVAALTAFSTMVSLMIVSTKLAGDNAAKAGVAMLGLSVSMIVLAAAMRVMSEIDSNGLAHATIAMSTLMGMIGVVLVMSKNAGDIKSTLIGLAASMAALAGVVVILSFVDSTRLAVATACLDTIIGMISLILYASSKAKKCTSTLAVLAVIMGELGLVLIKLAKMEPESVLSAAVSLGLVLTALSANMLVISKMSNLNVGAITTVGVLLVLLVAITKIFNHLDTMPGDNSLVLKATAISEVLLALALSTKLISSDSFDLKNMAIVGELTAVLLAISVVLWALKDMPADESLIFKATAISEVLLALSVATTVLSKASETEKSAMVTVGVMTAMLAGIATVFWCIRDMPADESLILKATVISTVLSVVTGLTVILSLVKDVSMSAMGAVAVLTVAIAGIATVFWCIRDMPADESLLIKATAISEVLIALTACTVALGLIGSAAVTAIAGAGALVAIVAILGTAMAAIGGLTYLLPDLETWINKGFAIFEAVAEGIGSVVGHLVGGIAEGVVDVLPNIGESLSQFAINGKDFFEMEFDPACMDGIKSLASAILIITGNQILDNLTRWLTGGTSMADFGESLGELGIGLKTFSESIDGVDTENVKMGADASKALADVANNLPRKGGFAQTILGEHMDFDTFGKELAGYGTALVEYANSVSGISNFDAIKDSATASEGLVELANNLPKRDGLLQQWFGQNIDFDTFGKELAGYGTALVEYANSVSGISNFDAIKDSATASEGLVELANNLPKRDGIFQTWFGQNVDFETFGAELTRYGTALVSYNNKISGLKDYTNITKSVAATEGLAELANSLPETASLKSWFMGGSMSMSTFGSELLLYAIALHDFADELDGVDTMKIADNAKYTGTALSDLANALPEASTWYNNVTDLDEFGKQIKSFGAGFKGYAEQVELVDMDAVRTSITEVNRLVSMAKDIQACDFSSMSAFGAGLTQLGMNGIDGFISAFTNAYDRVYAAGSDMVQQIVEGGNSKLTTAKVFFQGVVNDLVSVLSDSKSRFKTQASTMVNWMGLAFTENSYVVVNALQTLLSECYSKIQESYKTFRDYGVNIVTQLLAGLNTKANHIPGVFITALNSCINNIRAKQPEFYSAGAYLVDGFANGISANSFKAAAKASAMAAQAVKAAKEELDEHSPSKVFYKIGDFAGAGFVNALHDSAEDSYLAGSYMASEAKTGLSTAIAGISAMIAEDIDTQPTIRPVFDLSNIKAGSKTLNTMLDNNYAIGIGASINDSRAVLQNGGNLTSQFNNGNTYNLVQNNYSPKNLSRLDIYRQTNNQFSRLKEVLG